MFSFEYTDFRPFIKDRLALLQEKNDKLSQREFCRRAGFSSPGLLHAVLKGERKLSLASLKKFARAMELTREEAKYFSALVNFTQSPTDEDKTLAYKALLNFKGFRKAHTLAREQFEYYSSWLCPVLREMITLSNFREDYEKIANRIGSSVRSTDIKHALEILLKIGLIKRNANGKLEQTDPRVTSPDEVRSMFVRRFHHEMLKRAIVALETLPLKRREITNLTLTLNAERFSLLREEIVNFRQQIFEKYGDVRVGDDRVAQVNFQLFPLTLDVIE